MINPTHIQKISSELNISAKQIQSTLTLLDEGGTVPFISRYRKEMTGNLDEVQVMDIRDRAIQLRDLDKRRDAVLKSIKEQEKLTPELEKKILAAETMTVLEDLYLPYKPKKRTRATIAKEKGLEPLALLILQQNDDVDPNKEALEYLSKEKKVETYQEALTGAQDILAEIMAENAQVRQQIRSLYLSQGEFVCKVMRGKDEEGAKYKDYFDWKEPVAKAPSHRVLAMRRGEKEKILSLRILAPEDDAIDIVQGAFVTSNNASGILVSEAAQDSFKRLLSLSIESELRLLTKQQADEEAIRVFADNLRPLLMAPPLGEKNIMAIDPGFRTGCKVACINKQGKFLSFETIYPNQNESRDEQAAVALKKLCDEFKIEFIAIGNGTAGRETEKFIKDLKLSKVKVVMVNESGASIYSASKVARDEFPDQDITVRGAISIGRRLQDPLAELVKIDPKSIGVGQYQHDVDQKKLKQTLDDAVISCVNQVGVDLNTASKELLTYVSGLGPAMAQAIIDYRNKHGHFNSRTHLKEVPKLGAKAFEQAAGFLRINDAENPLDCSAVHPESYAIVDQMASDVGCQIKELIEDESKRDAIKLDQYVTDKIGLPTLKDIKSELAKPGRDPRQQFEVVEFDEAVHSVDDLVEGMELNGVVTNVTNFGAFVDIGVHQDGLVHISEMADKFIQHPNDVVKLQQQVKVRVVEIDKKRARIALSMKMEGGLASAKSTPTASNKGSASPKKTQKQSQAQPKSLNNIDLSSFI